MPVDRAVRTRPSSPVRFLVCYGWLSGKDTLVFGGNECDAKYIKESQVYSGKADFCTAPIPIPAPNQLYDVVIVPFVLDAIAPHEHDNAVLTARSFVRPRGAMFIATRKHPKGVHRHNGKFVKEIELSLPLLYDGEDYRLWVMNRSK